MCPRARTWLASRAMLGLRECAPARTHAVALLSAVAEPMLFGEQPRSHRVDQQRCRVAHIGDRQFAPGCVPDSDCERRAYKTSRTQCEES